MQICLISDTHSLHRRITIEKMDMLFFAGDFSLNNTEEETVDFLDWFCEQPARERVMISGNHDRFQWKHPDRFRELLDGRPIHYLENEETELMGIRIWGSPVTVPIIADRSRRFELSTEERKILWQRIPENTDILLTHTPPLGILDRVGGQHCGCSALADRVLTISPKFHFFGHIHEDSGILKQGRTTFSNGARFVSGTETCRNLNLVFNYPA